MTGSELTLLQHAAHGDLLFHIGTWGGSRGYRWCGAYGEEAGPLPPAQDLVLERLHACGLITHVPRTGPLDRQVSVTPAGQAALRQLPRPRQAA